MIGNQPPENVLLAGPPPNVRRLWLVRHGVTAWNLQRRFCGQSDQPLIEVGRQQAAWTGGVLASRQLARIYSSDLSRATETASLIAARQAQPPDLQTSAALRELSFGTWEGLTYTEAAAQSSGSTSFFEDPERHAPPGGETLAAGVQRLAAFVNQLLKEDEPPVRPPGEWLLVSHGGVLRGFLSSLLGMPLRNEWQLKLAHGSLSALDVVLEGDQVFAAVNLLNLSPPAELVSGPEGQAVETSSMRSETGAFPHA